MRHSKKMDERKDRHVYFTDIRRSTTCYVSRLRALFLLIPKTAIKYGAKKNENSWFHTLEAEFTILCWILNRGYEF